MQNFSLLHSQSSPSSLTTQKFGLRPMPSPPRLVIDHQTGDIVESYPEQPVYLRTYQPLEDTARYTEVNPSIEEFKLHNFCYNLRVLLVCLLSSYIIYLLVWPLSVDCTFYRTTYTHVSIIAASVNLVCILVFTLIWYCSGVTRTLYSNLSSSAFIITIYSILVAVNLAIGILFFFINTCHFQRLISTGSPLPSSIHQSVLPSMALTLQHPDQQQHHHHENHYQQLVAKLSDSRLALTISAPSIILADQSPSVASRDDRTELGSWASLGAETAYLHSREETSSGWPIVGGKRPVRASLLADRRFELYQDGDSANGVALTDTYLLDSSPDGEPDHQPHHNNQNDYPNQHLKQPSQLYLEPDYFSESPIEAAWLYIKDNLLWFRRKFNNFLLKYDLRVVGALHALVAICFQYLAIKVAVVRSHFCSPVGAYI